MGRITGIKILPECREFQILQKACIFILCCQQPGGFFCSGIIAAAAEDDIEALAGRVVDTAEFMTAFAGIDQICITETANV